MILFATFLMTVTNFPHFVSDISSIQGVPASGRRGSLRVNTTGSGDYTAIQAAIDNSSTGDTIIVDPGTYTENITISKSLQLVGSGPDATVIEGEGASNVVFINASWVNVSGFNINNSEMGFGCSGLYIYDSNNCKVDNNLFTNCWNGIHSVHSEGNTFSNNTFLQIRANAIGLNNSNFTNIINNTCESEEAEGAYLFESHWNIIRDNIYDNNDFGIYIIGTNNSIYNNSCNSNSMQGIILLRSGFNQVYNNTCNWNSMYGILISESNFNLIFSNICDGNRDSGIYAISSESNSIFNNTCDENWDDGIHIRYSHNNEIFSNTCKDNWYRGIYLDNSFSNYIKDNNCYSNSYGIYLMESRYNNVFSNECEFNNYGIQIDYSLLNSVINNSCESNNDGINILNSESNNITGNICYDNNADGIEISSSSSNYVSDNICESNYYSGIRIYRSDLNLLINNTCILNRYDGLSLYNSNENIIVNNTSKNNFGEGVHLDESDSNEILNNNFNSNRRGIYLYNSDNNEIFNNGCDYNSRDGIYISFSHSNELFNNTFTENQREGISISNSDWNSIENNTCDLNTWNGLSLYYSDNNNLSKNNCSFNEDDGIILYSSQQNNVRNNSISSNNNGIVLSHSSSTNLTENTCRYNREDGIKISSSHRNYVRNNSINSNNNGILLRFSYWNVVTGNICMNVNTGIYLYLSDDNIISGIKSENNVYGIKLYGAFSNLLSDSIFSLNKRDGIYIEESNNNIILNNTILSNNGNGTTLNQSYNNIIYNCQFEDNYNGISNSEGWKNDFSNNDIIDGKGSGIALFYSQNTIITYNSISDNSECGIYLTGSINNTIHHNDLIHSQHQVSLAYDDGWNNSWDDGTEGNYWSNYLFHNYNAGTYGKIWDIPYQIEGNSSQDNCSLRFPVDRYLEIPIACAGPDMTIDQFDKFVFNSTLSFDHIGIENFSWSFRYDDREVKIFGPSPSFGFNIMGVYEILLTVNNSRGETDDDTFFITVLDREPPWIGVYENITIDQHESAVFNAGNCSDNRGIVNITWMVEYLDLKYFRYGMTSNFTFPEAGFYPVTILLNDSRNNTNQSTFYVQVRDITPPLAVGGGDQTVDQYERFYLDASWSEDNVGILRHTWTFYYNEKNWTCGGSQMDFTFYEAGKYIIVLNVSDEAGNWAIDLVTITVLDVEAPLADAGGNLTAKVGVEMKFNGTASLDNVGIHNYSWSFPFLGAQMVLYGPAPEYTFTDPGMYQIKLNVTDKAGNSNFDTIFVFVEIDNDDQEIPEEEEPDKNEKTDKDSISFYICSGILIASILVVVLNGLYKKKKLRNPQGKAEEVNVSGMIDDISDSFFKKREDEDYDYCLPKVVLRKKEAEPTRVPRAKQPEKKKVMVKVVRKKKIEKETRGPDTSDMEVMEVEPLDLTDEYGAFNGDENSELKAEEHKKEQKEIHGGDIYSESKDEDHGTDEKEKDIDADSAETEFEEEMDEEEKSIEEFMISIKAEIEALEAGDDFKDGFLQGYERALEELRGD